MSIFWFVLGITVGIFVPGPFDEVIRNGIKSLFNKIVKKIKKGG